jgi:uncharacterized coiled-coil DUF342 family protein
MPTTMVREAWTDERLDDLSANMKTEFAELRADTRSMRGEIGAVRSEIGEVREELGELRGEMNAKFDALNRTLQIGFGLVGTFLAGLIGLIGIQL